MERILLRLVKRWIAGTTRGEAIGHARHLNKTGIHATINYLGEHYKDLASVENATKEYVDLCKDIKKAKADASISVKPSELGMDFSEKLCRRELHEILESAQKAGVFVWIDMESHAYTDRTLKLYAHFLPRFPKLGITLQAALQRSEKDLAVLLKMPGSKIRLVKGAYHEPKYLSVGGKKEVGKAYRSLAKKMFQAENAVAIATHDNGLIEFARLFGKKDCVEFQMLMGIHNRMKRKLAGQRCSVTEYIPYGKNWKAYVKRRLLEKPENVVRVLASLFT